MEYFDKIKQSVTGEAVPVAVPEVPVAAESPPPIDTTNGSTWTTFVESMDHARKRASVIFTIPENNHHVEHSDGKIIPDTPNAPIQAGSVGQTEAPASSVVTSAVKSWWEEAASFMEEAKMSVEEKISEMTAPVEIKNDPLRKLRELLVVYSDSLEELKTESFNFAMAAENVSRLGSAGLERTVAEAFLPNSLVPKYFSLYKGVHTKSVEPALEEVRQSSEEITALITEELTKIQTAQTRFRRRDRLHKTLQDMRARVDLRREKNNRKLVEGIPVDAKSMEELYELTRGMDSVEADFRITSEQLVGKCNELLGNRGRSFGAIFLRLLETQNAFFYRISTFASVPFQELVESFRARPPLPDELEDLGPHALTWRSHPNSDEEVSVPAPSRRATVNINSAELASLSPVSPSRYSYRRERQVGVSPIRRAGTAAVLD